MKNSFSVFFLISIIQCYFSLIETSSGSSTFVREYRAQVGRPLGYAL